MFQEISSISIHNFCILKPSNYGDSKYFYFAHQLYGLRHNCAGEESQSKWIVTCKPKKILKNDHPIESDPVDH